MHAIPVLLVAVVNLIGAIVAFSIALGFSLASIHRS